MDSVPKAIQGDEKLDSIQLEPPCQSGIISPRQVEPDTPLSSEHHIRLLHIDSVSEDTVKCELWEYPSPVSRVDRAYHYVALSYCWGDEGADRTITINDKEFLVTSNLLHALQEAGAFFKVPNLTAIISRDFEIEPVLWVDAICLNQKDEDEKSVQVQRMSEIYSGAARVLIWLGRDTNDHALVMGVCQWLEFCLMSDKVKDDNDIEESATLFSTESASCTQALQHTYGVSHDSLVRFRNALRDIKKFSVLQILQMTLEQRLSLIAGLCAAPDTFSPGGTFWSAFLSLMAHPWFHRVWTLQEIMLAKDATVLCSGCCVDWSLVLQIRECFYTTGWVKHLFSIETEEDATDAEQALLQNDSFESSALYQIPEGLKMLNTAGRFQYLLLTSYRTRQARDPKDCIYGLLGLLDSEFRLGLRVDYKQPTAHVFANAIKAISEEQNSVCIFLPLMAFLERLNYTKKSLELELPSWCPDFSAGPCKPKLTEDHTHSIYTALRGRLHPPRMTLITEEFRMVASVILLDEIKYSVTVSPPAEIRDAARRTSDRLISWLTWHNYRFICREWFRAILDFLTRPEISASEEKMEWFRDVAWPYKPLNISKETAFQAFRIGAESAEPWCHQLHPEDNDLSPAYLLYQALLWNHSKFFLVTKQGRVGFSMEPTRYGDMLCYIPRGKYLQVLSADCDQFVTSASVHGLMGDALLEVVGTSPTWTTVLLR